jgi:hypothetical protein
MVGRVPSSARKVDAAAEGEDAIDGNQLVVLRRCRRRVDEPKIAAPPMPAQIGEKGAVFPVAAIDQRPVPQENADFEFRPARQQTLEKAYKRLSLQSAAFGVQHEQGIEVPARKKDQSTRSRQTGGQGGKIIGIGQHRGSGRALDPPAIATLFQDRWDRHRRGPAGRLRGIRQRQQARDAVRSLGLETPIHRPWARPPFCAPDERSRGRSLPTSAAIAQHGGGVRGAVSFTPALSRYASGLLSLPERSGEHGVGLVAETAD